MKWHITTRPIFTLGREAMAMVVTPHEISLAGASHTSVVVLFCCWQYNGNTNTKLQRQKTKCVLYIIV